MAVRPATATDIPRLMALASNAGSAAQWNAETYARIFAADAPSRMSLILEEQSGGELYGFLIALCSGEEWEIENVVIADSERRRGHGRLLLRELLERARAAGAKAVFLEVRESNRAARRLYESCAFGVAGRRPAYYSDPPEDAIVYRFSTAR